jgi:hypothetical protein
MDLQKIRLERTKGRRAVFLRCGRQEQWLLIAAKRGKEAQL